MTAIELRCACGERFQAAPEHAGRRIRCRCGRTVEVRAAPGEPARPTGGGRTRHRRRVRKRPGARGSRAAGAVTSWLRALRGVRLPRPAHGLRSPDARIRWLAYAAWSYLLLACVAWLVLWMLSERWWPATVFLFGPRWVLLLPLLALLPAAAVLARALLWPLLAAAVIVLVPVVGFRIGVVDRLATLGRQADVRVVSINAGGRDGVAREITASLGEWRPDVVAVQECSVRMARTFERVRGWHHRSDRQFCLLSRFPIDSAWTADGRGLEMVRASGLGGTSDGVQYVLRTPDGPVHFAQVHLETPRRGLAGLFEDDVGRVSDNSVVRGVESRRMRRWLGTESDRLVIAGDFNMPVESPIYRESWGEFRNAFSRAGLGFGATRDNGWIQVRIDHVLTGDDWRVVRAFVGPDVGSDHRPVIADLRSVRKS